jgi:hypothetical protein
MAWHCHVTCKREIVISPTNNLDGRVYHGICAGVLALLPFEEGD